MKQGRLSNFIAKILLFLFNPLSPVVVLIVGGVISLIVNEISTNKLVPPKVMVWVMIIWLVITVTYQIFIHLESVYQNALKEKEDEITRLNENLKDRDIQIKNNIGLIEARYGEFSEYINIKKINVLLNKIINAHTYVDAIQVHNYTIGCSHENINIRLSYYTGIEYEQVDINAIKQKYFSIEKDSYLKFLELQKNYIDIINSKLKLNPEVKEFFSHKAQELLEQLSQNTNEVNKRIFLIVIQMLKTMCVNDEFSQLVVDDMEGDSKRTGILGAILTNNAYLYNYNKQQETKKNRLYLSFCDIINGENKAITFAINISTVNEADRSELINDVLDTYFKELKNIN